MRIPDSLLQINFLNNLNKSRSALAEIQTQLTTRNKVNRPSDNPLSNSRIMRIQNQLKSIETYKNNITYGKSMIEDSILSMESMQNEIDNILVQLTQLNSAVVGEDLSTFANSLDSSLNMLLELANSEFNGKYSFGGSESGTKPFYYDKENNRVIVNSQHIGGGNFVKISPSTTQRFNISGKELFQSVFTQNGNLNSEAGIGNVQSTSSNIYDSEGNKYTINLDYTLTAANTYELNYSIIDSSSNVIDTKTVSDIKFNASTGTFESIGSDKFGEIHVELPNNKIDFVIDLNLLKEKNAETNLGGNLSQNADIFNTLIGIRDKLLAGEKPTEEQANMISKFNQHLLNKLSFAGGILNKINDTEQILINREVEASELLSIENDVDIAKALIDLENRQYSLDISYRISSMILPKSLLDYL